MLERYKNDESHFIIRFVIFGFVLFSFLYIDPNQRSCLGPPRLLPFVFFGFPLITFLLSLDLIVLAVLKAINWQKVLVNLGLFLAVIFYFFCVFR